MRQCLKKAHRLTSVFKFNIYTIPWKLKKRALLIYSVVRSLFIQLCNCFHIFTPMWLWRVGSLCSFCIFWSMKRFFQSYKVVLQPFDIKFSLLIKVLKTALKMLHFCLNGNGSSSLWNANLWSSPGKF